MLSRAFKIASVGGIPLLIHWTFGFFFIWIAYAGYRAGLDDGGVLRLCLFALLLFVCVVLHEFGHAFMAKKYGITTKDIIISPIGGVARLVRMPKRPWQEVWIALAGPAVNFLIALILGILLSAFSSRGVLPSGELEFIFHDPGNFFQILFLINLALILFNMVPAFPMDGGRVFRALLSVRLGRLRATKIATRLGQVVSILFIAFAFAKGDLILAFIGVFVFVAAANEFSIIQTESVLNAGTTSDIFRTRYTPMFTSDIMQKAIDISAQSSEKNFVVVDQFGAVKGIIPEQAVTKAKEQSDGQAPVEKYWIEKFEAVSDRSSARTLLQLFQSDGYSILPVISFGQLIGVVDRRDFSAYLQRHAGFFKNWS